MSLNPIYHVILTFSCSFESIISIAQFLHHKMSIYQWNNWKTNHLIILNHNKNLWLVQSWNLETKMCCFHLCLVWSSVVQLVVHRSLIKSNASSWLRFRKRKFDIKRIWVSCTLMAQHSYWKRLCPILMFMIIYISLRNNFISKNLMTFFVKIIMYFWSLICFLLKFFLYELYVQSNYHVRR